MYADTQETSDSYKSHAEKIIKVRGCLLAFSGASADCDIVEEWFHSYDGELTLEHMRDSLHQVTAFDTTISLEGCLVTPDNTVYNIIGNNITRHKGRFYYAGSGTPFMMAVIELKKCPLTAIQIACKLDINSGQPIQKVEL